MNAMYRTIIWALVLTLLIPSMATSAIKKGRLIGKVIDPDGNPIEGVTVTATSEDVSGFKEIEVTDKKGVFKLDFEELNVVYRYRFDKVGYQTMETEQTWQKEGSARYKFTMHPGESAMAAELSPATIITRAVQSFKAGAAAFDSGDYQGAISHFEAALESDPELRQAWGALSVAQLEAQQYEEAAASAEKAIELGATDQLVHRTRWEAYRNLGDEEKTAEALAAAERAGSMAEEAKKVFNEAVRLGKADDHEGAYARFKEASELDPNLEEALHGLATTALQTERYAEAQAAAERILTIDPGNERALGVRYNASLQLGDEDLIAEALVGLAAIQPETAATGLWQLALAAYDANDMERARTRFSNLLTIDPSRAHCHYYLGLINVSEGENDAARGHFEKFLEMAPDDAEVPSVRDFLTHLQGS